jgi:hypothetical protein
MHDKKKGRALYEVRPFLFIMHHGIAPSLILGRTDLLRHVGFACGEEAIVKPLKGGPVMQFRVNSFLLPFSDIL